MIQNQNKVYHLWDYFVCYMGIDTDNGYTKLSNCRLLRKAPIASWQDIQDIQDDIDKYTKFTSATMINYNLLCERDFNEDELPEYFRQGELMSDESD